MEPWIGYLLGGYSTMLTVLLGIVVKMAFNHLTHVSQDVKEIRTLMIEHLRDHGKAA